MCQLSPYSKSFQRGGRDKIVYLICCLNVMFVFSLIPCFCPQIPNGRKYNKMWLINLLQSYCSVGFTPVDVRVNTEPQCVHAGDRERLGSLQDVGLQHHLCCLYSLQFQYIRNSIQFFVQSAKTAVELMNINYQISDEENEKVGVDEIF